MTIALTIFFILSLVFITLWLEERNKAKELDDAVWYWHDYYFKTYKEKQNLIKSIEELKAKLYVEDIKKINGS